MEQGLELEGLVALICDSHGASETGLAECDVVHKVKFVWPLAPDTVTQFLRTQTKVELDTVISLCARALVAALAQELPFGVPGKAVLW